MGLDGSHLRAVGESPAWLDSHWPLGRRWTMAGHLPAIVERRDSFVIKRAARFPRRYRYSLRFYWVSLGFIGFNRDLRGFSAMYWVLLFFYWILLASTGLH